MNNRRTRMFLILGMALAFFVGKASGVSAIPYLEQIKAYLDHGIQLNLNGSEWLPKDSDGADLAPIW